MSHSTLTNTVYYQLKPLIPRSTQIWLRRQIVSRKRKAHADVWPILEQAGQPPPGWPGWPNQKRFAFSLMHDVELDIGQQRCLRLANLEKEAGFYSSFNFVPERYRVLPEVRHKLTTQGFEVGVHGLNHDGKLYQSRQIFQERAPKINNYLNEWNSVGHCSPASHHNLEWNHDLTILYDSSTFDTDPFEPQPDGLQTIFPVWVPGNSPQRGYVELPYTLPQDFTLFILLQEKNIEIWKRKLDWIADKGGMALVITHPDYMNFEGTKPGLQEYPVEYYLEFLAYVKNQYEGQYWHALPKDMAFFVKNQQSCPS